ncbi:TPA: SHP2/SHP3 family peptide pheromone, partial [Streptococcus pneumoniae]
MKGSQSMKKISKFLPILFLVMDII